jgi:hypothetical protein
MTEIMKISTQNKTMDSPLSDSSVSLKLSLIQKRCRELMDQPDALELAPDDGEPGRNSGDPYNHLR